MAQIFLDQKNSQIRLKQELHEMASKLLVSDTVINQNDSKSVLNNKHYAQESHDETYIVASASKLINKSSLILSRGNITLEDGDACDDPAVNSFTLQNKSKKVKGFSCIICGLVASSSHRLKEHLSRHTGVKNLECNICGKKFAWRYSFKSHMVAHSKDNPNKCSICDKKYCNKSSVRNHMLRVHSNPEKLYKCDKCDKAFVTAPELKRHSRNHSKDKPFTCEYCGNSYKYEVSLIIHYKIHSGEKPYKCRYCDKEFLHLSSAIGHRRRHTGEMTYQCKECGKLFHVKREMTAHMSVHSEEKPFKCEKCGKGFKSRSGFKVHLDFHLGIKRHKCKFCERTFSAWCNMHKHMKRHLREKVHKCELCEESFIGKVELRNHVKSHYTDVKKCNRGNENSNIVINNCVPIIPSANSSYSAVNLSPGNPSTFNEPEANVEMISSHMDITDNQAVMYDCSLPNSIDKCNDKSQLLQDSYVSQFLYPPHSSYTSPAVPILNMYSSEQLCSVNRSACVTPNYSLVALNNQNYGSFAYTIPTADELVSKCKLCRSLFQNTILLRSHLIEYHRIEEDSVDDLIT